MSRKKTSSEIYSTATHWSQSQVLVKRHCRFSTSTPASRERGRDTEIFYCLFRVFVFFGRVKFCGDIKEKIKKTTNELFLYFS